MIAAGAESRSMIFGFGEFELDESLYQLRRRGEVVRLEPKVFDVLAYLVRQRHRVVAKDELLAQLWPGESVSESVLPRCITAARKAVGHDPSGQKVIQTVHGRGYRFVASIADDAKRSISEDGAGAERPAGVFVGREQAMADLRAALEDADRGRAGDRRRAAALLDQALACATELGLAEERTKMTAELRQRAADGRHQELRRKTSRSRRD